MTSKTNTYRNHDVIITELIARKIEIEAMLARIQALSDERFGYGVDEIDYGHVGDLADYASLLKRITARAFGEGEYAD